MALFKPAQLHGERERTIDTTIHGWRGKFWQMVYNLPIPISTMNNQRPSSRLAKIPPSKNLSRMYSTTE